MKKLEEICNIMTSYQNLKNYQKWQCIFALKKHEVHLWNNEVF